jgi:hypothetical protein
MEAKMKSYLAVFTGKPESMSNWQNLPEIERQKKEAEGMSAWKKWADDHGSSIVEMGGPLSKTKRISKSGISDVRNNLGAFTIVKADSQEAAAKMFVNHPHFTIFPGDGVEVMEVLPIPGEQPRTGATKAKKPQ